MAAASRTPVSRLWRMTVRSLLIGFFSVTYSARGKDSGASRSGVVRA